MQLFLRTPAGTFAARRPVPFERTDLKNKPRFPGLDRGHPRPNLLDWDRDGNTDLVVGEPSEWTLFVARGPLNFAKPIEVKPFPLPRPRPRGLEGAQPQYFQFTDWDGDGNTDLLVGVQQPPDREGGPWPYAVYWLRNTARRGDPNYDAPVKLIDVPAPWELNAIATDDSPGPGRQHLVVSLTKDWKRNADGGWSVVSQLWRYRR